MHEQQTTSLESLDLTSISQAVHLTLIDSCFYSYGPRPVKQSLPHWPSAKDLLPATTLTHDGPWPSVEALPPICSSQ